MITQIENRIAIAMNNLDYPNYKELFPLLLDDIKYMLVDINKDTDKLSPSEQFMHGSEITLKKAAYFAKLTQLYFRMKYQTELKIMNKSDMSLATAGGGYSEKEDIIYYSKMGAILSRTSDLSHLHTFIHEGRHKLQKISYKTQDILSIEPHMIRLLKEAALEKSLKENNREFYTNNYNTLLTENDAEIFARNEVANFINHLTQMYMSLHNEASPEMEAALLKANELNYIFSEILKEEEYNIDTNIEAQLKSGDLTNCDYKINEETVDRVIMLDKFIKLNPQLQNEYPLLTLLFNGNKPKTYEEIIMDRENLKRGKTPEEKEKIMVVYNEIIVMDPILYITDLLSQNNIEAVEQYMTTHPTIVSEYTNEISHLKEIYGDFGPKTL